MKKSGYLLLLVPTLFLASCQTTPKINTITIAEAEEIIAKFDNTAFVNPTTESKVKWKITSGDDAGNQIASYIYPSGGLHEGDDGNKGVNIDSTRCGTYVSELDPSQVSDFTALGKDAIIGVNTTIHNKMRQVYSLSNDVGRFYLEYYRNGGGIKIVAKSTQYNTKYTRTHYYNEVGQETKFEVDVSQNNASLVYTMSIDFKYQA